MKNIFYSIFTFLALQLCAFPAYSLCLGLGLTNISITSSSSFSGATSGYAPYDANEYIQTVNFTVNQAANLTTCNYFMVLSAGKSGSVTQRKLSITPSLDYNVYVNPDKANILKSCGTTSSSSEVITGNFPVIAIARSNNHSLYWTINPLQAVNPATYSDTSLTLSLYSGTISGGCVQLLDSKTITFQATVASYVDLSLVGTGSVFDVNDVTQLMNFGTLNTGSQQAFDLLIRSNNGYSVTMQSNNSQVLRHSNYPAISNNINYGLTFNSGAINLASGSAVNVVTSTTGATTASTGARFPIQATIGTVSSALPAGTYSDIISIVLSAN